MHDFGVFLNQILILEGWHTSQNIFLKIESFFLRLQEYKGPALAMHVFLSTSNVKQKVPNCCAFNSTLHLNGTCKVTEQVIRELHLLPLSLNFFPSSTAQ